MKMQAPFFEKFKQRGLKVYACANDTGVGLTTLYNWAAGRSKPDFWSGDMDKVIFWARERGVDLSYSDFVTND